MNNSIFVTYHIKLFPRSPPRKLHRNSPLLHSLTKTNNFNTKRQIDFFFKSSRKLQQYRLIRFISNTFNGIFFIRLSILFWKQYKEESITSNKYWVRVLKLVDQGFYHILNVTDLWFVVFAFPIVSYGDSLWFNMKHIFNREFNNLIKESSPLCKWFERYVFKKVDSIFTPIYLFLIDTVLTKGKLNILKNEQLSSEVSGLVRLIYIILKIKFLIFDYLIRLLISVFQRPFNYLMRINNLLNYYLSHQNRINLISVLRLFQNVVVILWLEWKEYFGKR